ncbi:MAG: SRPBCC domain-containing protein [Deltaproteobacteria bacterium]|nr:SRPBCC domain-containing protein [Deltaproteobacteria bacterium]
MDRKNIIGSEFTIGADAAMVFAFFTDPQRLIRWIGLGTARSRPGEIFVVDINPGWIARGEFKEVVPVTRLACT